jgi:hypothetical protein
MNAKPTLFLATIEWKNSKIPLKNQQSIIQEIVVDFTAQEQLATCHNENFQQICNPRE